MATSFEKKSHTRLLIASSLFLASVLASFLISYISHQGDSYWVTTRAIAKGVQIAPADVTLARSDLTSAIKGYLTDRGNPIGSISRRAMAAGELVNDVALSENIDDLTTESISISIRSSDLPLNAGAGDVVSLYQVHDSRNGESVPEPVRVISGVFIKEISERGSNFGSDVALTISLHRDDISRVLAATASGRLVVVANRG
jgi:hypothetical protein